MPNITGGLLRSCRIISVPPVCPLLDRLMSNATASEETAGERENPHSQRSHRHMPLNVKCRNNFDYLLIGIHLLETSLCRKKKKSCICDPFFYHWHIYMEGHSGVRFIRNTGPAVQKEVRFCFVRDCNFYIQKLKSR